MGTPMYQPDYGPDHFVDYGANMTNPLNLVDDNVSSFGYANYSHGTTEMLWQFVKPDTVYDYRIRYIGEGFGGGQDSFILLYCADGNSLPEFIDVIYAEEGFVNTTLDCGKSITHNLTIKIKTLASYYNDYTHVYSFYPEWYSEIMDNPTPNASNSHYNGTHYVYDENETIVFDADLVDDVPINSTISGWFVNGVKKTANAVWTWILDMFDEGDYSVTANFTDTSGNNEEYSLSLHVKDTYNISDPIDITPYEGVYDSYVLVECHPPNELYNGHVNYTIEALYDSAWNVILNYSMTNAFNWDVRNIASQDNVTFRCRIDYEGSQSNYFTSNRSVTINHNYTLRVIENNNNDFYLPNIPYGFGVHCNVSDYDYTVNGLYVDCDNDGINEHYANFNESNYDSVVKGFNCEWGYESIQHVRIGCIVNKTSSDAWDSNVCINGDNSYHLCEVYNVYKVHIV